MTAAFDIRTTPFSRWNVENASDEPAHGYFARLVAAEGHLSVTRYSDGIDLDTRTVSPQALLDVILKLPLSGDSKLRLRNATPERRDDGVWLASQRFNATDLSFSTRRWCPGCLHESPHHRAWWDIVAITDCPFHCRELVDRDEYGNPVRWWWPVMNASPRGALLSRLLPRSDNAKSFANYVIGRLGFGPAITAPLLDRSDLGQVIDICQLIGKLLSSPWSSETPTFTPEMTEVGFQAMRLDAAAFVETVRTWLRMNVSPELRMRGYGHVFDWAIQRWVLLPDVHITDMLQKVFRKALALEGRCSTEPLTSDAFLEEEISLAALAHRMGVARNGIATVADMLGFLPSRERYRGLVMFDAEEADGIEYQWHQMAGRAEVGAMLGLTFREITPLVEAGYLREFSSVTFEGEAGYRYLKADIEDVLASLAVACKKASLETLTSFRHYAKDHKLSRGDLAVSILRGEVDVVVAASGKVGFEALAIICEPVKSTRRPLRKLQRGDDVLSRGEAEVELNVTRATLVRLIEEEHLKEGQGDGAARWLDKASVLGFAAEHRNASQYLCSLQINLDEMIAVMAANGFEPVLSRRPKAEFRSVNTIYRYQDIASAFGLKSDSTRIDDPEFDGFWQRVRALGGNMPPYLQFPSHLPVDGQLVSNAGNKIAFFVSYEPEMQLLRFEGRRQASNLGTVVLRVSNPDGSLVRLEEVLVTLIRKTPRKR
jgi:hypothetical protein